VSIFGNIISDDVVEDAVTATLQRWIDTELSEIERQRHVAVGFYARPRAWEIRNDMDKWPEEALPAVIVISTGLADAPVRDGRRDYRATYAIGVATVCGSVNASEARKSAHRLGAAVRASLVHHQSLDHGINSQVRGVDWIDGRNNEINVDATRSVWAVRQIFTVEVADVLVRSAGPIVPDVSTDVPPTHPDSPVVSDTDIGVGHL
jgi:hypothetical protein